MDNFKVTLDPIKLDELEFKKGILGRGGFGVVKLSYHKRRSCWYAVKILNTTIGRAKPNTER